jgi:integrase
MASDGRRGSVKPEKCTPDGKPASGTTWRFVVDVSLPGQKRRQVQRRGFSTKKAAQGALTSLLSDMTKNQYVPPSKLTLAEFLETRWLPWLRGQVRSSTYESYARNLRLHVIPDLGDVHLQAIDSGALMALYSRLRAHGRMDHRSGTGLSVTSVRYVHTILRSAMQSAVDWDLLQRNPADRAKPPSATAQSTRHEAIRAWPRELLARFIRETRTDPLHSAWLLLSTTGVRRGEALGLGWEAVDLERGVISIRRSLVDVTTVATGSEPVYSDPKTARGRRTITLDKGTVEALRQHRARQLQDRLLLGSAWPDHGLVFVDALGRPLHPDRFARRFRHVVAQLGLPPIRVHDLRHTWATLALEAGVHPKVVSERLGHANINITLEIYSHVTLAMQTDAADRVAALFLGDSS